MIRVPACVSIVLRRSAARYSLTNANLSRRLLGLVATLAVVAGWLTSAAAAEPPKPLKVLLITGGCCHDYVKQKEILKQGLEARAHVVVTLEHTDDKSTKARFARYEKPDWATGFDVIIHDECSADVKEMPYVLNILAAHRAGIPAVNLHCAMHCYRTGTEDWFSFIGIQSSGHGKQQPIELNLVDQEHPITKGLSNWTTINEELYNNLKLFPTAHPLIRGKQTVADKESDYVVAWTNQYGPTRVFNTTVGHNNDTVADARYLDLVTRGLLWSCDKLNDTYLKPAPIAKPAAPGPQPTLAPPPGSKPIK